LHLDLHESMYQSARIDGSTCTATVAASIYEQADSAGRQTMQSVLERACSSSYKFIAGNGSRRIPETGLRVVLKDVTGNDLYTATVSPSPVDIVLKKPQSSHEDGMGAYTVVDHYIWNCSSNGGFGEKAIVKSHLQSDLNAAVQRWMAANASDKSLCLHFEAYATAQSYDAGQNPSHYSDAELGRIPYGAQYTNNPNTHYEAWTDAKGEEHVLHPAS
jgi:hypothetical protein